MKNNCFQNEIIDSNLSYDSIYNSSTRYTPKKPINKIKETEYNIIDKKEKLVNNKIFCINKIQRLEPKYIPCKKDKISNKENYENANINKNFISFSNFGNFQNENINAENLEKNFYNNNNGDRMSISSSDQDKNENNHNSTITEVQKENSNDNLKAFIYTDNSHSEINETNIINGNYELLSLFSNSENENNKGFIEGFNEYFDNNDEILKNEVLDVNLNIKGFMNMKKINNYCLEKVSFYNIL